MTTRRTITALTAALALATGGFLAAGAEATDSGTGPDQVVWAQTTGTNATDLLSGVQVGSYKGDNLQSTNVARADSTDCTDCRTVAVAVQAVLVKHRPPNAEPKNFAIAVNQNCLNCTTYAYAYQFVVATEERTVLTYEGRERVATLRERIDAAAHSDLDPAALTERLDSLAADFKAAVKQDLDRQDVDIEARQVHRDSELE